MAQILTMQSYNYSNNSNITAAQRTATQLLKSYFTAAHCFINTPAFIFPNSAHTQGVVVQLFYYVDASAKSGKLTSNIINTVQGVSTSHGAMEQEKLSSSALKTLGTALSRVFSVA